MKIAPSVLAGDLADLRASLSMIEQAGCDLVHWDAMDGRFVPNLTFGPPVIRAARRYTKLPFDVHLMVEQPEPYVAGLAELGIEQLSFHIETERYSPRLCSHIRANGMRPFIAANPQTPVSQLEPLLPLVDGVMLMSVDPGFAGQAFLPPVLGKIAALAELRVRDGLKFLIEVDGGVSDANIEQLAGLGVDIVVAGKAFFNATEPMVFARRVQSLH